jgi:hypothetical protein
MRAARRSEGCCGASGSSTCTQASAQGVQTAAGRMSLTTHRPVLEHHLRVHGVRQLLVRPEGEVELGLAGLGVLVGLVAARLLQGWRQSGAASASARRMPAKRPLTIMQVAAAGCSAPGARPPGSSTRRRGGLRDQFRSGKVRAEHRLLRGLQPGAQATGSWSCMAAHEGSPHSRRARTCLGAVVAGADVDDPDAHALLGVPALDVPEAAGGSGGGRQQRVRSKLGCCWVRPRRLAPAAAAAAAVQLHARGLHCKPPPTHT